MEAIQTADVSHTVPTACGDFSLANEPRMVSIVEIIDAGLDDLADDIQADFASQTDVDEPLGEIREKLPKG